MIFGVLALLLFMFLSDYSKRAISGGKNATDPMNATDLSITKKVPLPYQRSKHPRTENSKSFHKILLAGLNRRDKRQIPPEELPEHQENMQKFANVATITIQRSVHMIYTVLKAFYDAITFHRGWGGQPLEIDITRPVWYIKNRLWSYVRNSEHVKMDKPK